MIDLLLHISVKVCTEFSVAFTRGPCQAIRRVVLKSSTEMKELKSSVISYVNLIHCGKAV